MQPVTRPKVAPPIDEWGGRVGPSLATDVHAADQCGAR